VGVGGEGVSTVGVFTVGVLAGTSTVGVFTVAVGVLTVGVLTVGGGGSVVGVLTFGTFTVGVPGLGVLTVGTVTVGVEPQTATQTAVCLAALSAAAQFCGDGLFSQASLPGEGFGAAGSRCRAAAVWRVGNAQSTPGAELHSAESGHSHSCGLPLIGPQTLLSRGS
jgi:hypothetical protein